MDRVEWLDLLDRLAAYSETVRKWAPTPPDPDASRCEQSRHRTLAHLRACQEQWLSVVKSFIDRDRPSVTILHSWRQFDVEGYATLDWDLHMRSFLEDRRAWLGLRDEADWERGGRWNRKPDTIGGLTERLANHEAHHLRFFPS